MILGILRGPITDDPEGLLKQWWNGHHGYDADAPIGTLEFFSRMEKEEK